MPKVDLDTARLACGARLPTREEWQSELESGWEGPNGSSFSTDKIFGVETGRTGRDYSREPADVHDFWYRVLRRLLLTTTLEVPESELLRERADGQFHRGLLVLRKKVAATWRLRRLGTAVRVLVSPLFRLRAHFRWRAVRDFGGLVNRPDLGEEKFF